MVTIGCALRLLLFIALTCIACSQVRRCSACSQAAIKQAMRAVLPTRWQMRQRQHATLHASAAPASTAAAGFTVVSCALQASAVITHTTVMRPQFVTFGDSITQRGFEPGWGSLLANAYQRRADVVSRGYSGYNSRWALQLLDAVFPQPSAAAPPPRLATVFFGANDAALPDRGS